MPKIETGILRFLEDQGCVIVTTIDKKGFPHSACKGIAKIKPDGTIYILDLYYGATYENLKTNKNISITALNEHNFKGYCLKGKAKIKNDATSNRHLMKNWDSKVTSRIAQRFIKNIKGETGHPKHPEASFPKPKYIIEVAIKEIVNLAPVNMEPKGG